jgi:hypothetical protein
MDFWNEDERASERVVTNGIQKRKRLGLGVLDLWLKDKRV